MQHRTRKATAVGAAAFVLAGSAVFATPGTASADTVNARCGDTVTVKPGDVVSTPFGLQTVTDGLTSLVGGLLGGLCQITVKVVDTVVAPVPVVGAPAASAVDQAVQGTTNGISKTTGDLGHALGGGQPARQDPGPGGSPQQPPNTGPGAPQGGAPAGQSPIPGVNSPLLPSSAGGGAGPLASMIPNFAGLPFGYSTGYAPMRDYSNIPMAMAGLFTPSPALRYGSQIPGYQPQYGLSSPAGPASGNAGVQNAGQAEALPTDGGNHTNGLDWPMLVAVLALSGVSAGLVRTWVLRRMAASA
ncbi:hypothetical protein [Amycolatopsis sp. PS_44_ISF1]|uniref:hypothetical protein n=1 Tax=Amycolatopsis sp. PS_44_ISF1 TaxID=2974917 RepID=UPI0028E05CB9|nr:hypothetical protein [Amycolatopsis sp. PS_44_ISF1]MDT8910497.1 hypothetical protein [Amycolatopsis sp. PS_44_ISF1]